MQQGDILDFNLNSFLSLSFSLVLKLRPTNLLFCIFAPSPCLPSYYAALITVCRNEEGDGNAAHKPCMKANTLHGNQHQRT